MLLMLKRALLEALVCHWNCDPMADRNIIIISDSNGRFGTVFLDIGHICGQILSPFGSKLLCGIDSLMAHERHGKS